MEEAEHLDLSLLGEVVLGFWDGMMTFFLLSVAPDIFYH